VTDDSAASRLAALRQHPEVEPLLWDNRMAAKELEEATTPEDQTRTWHAWVASRNALLSAVAAAATREAEREFCLCLLPEGADTINRVTTRMLDRRALAGGAPQGVSDAPTDDCPGCSHAKTWHGATGCDAPYCRCRAMAGHFDA
jgi:hypothetical protein